MHSCQILHQNRYSEIFNDIIAGQSL